MQQNIQYQERMMATEQVAVTSDLSRMIQSYSGRAFAEVEKQVIFEALKLNQQNKTHTAKTLGIGIRTLQRKLKSYQ